ncbi:MAG: magnesium transporter [Acholeplasmataceae bacterium]|nr:magnesium transporter [Acholeplasmataceae bacterium]
MLKDLINNGNNEQITEYINDLHAHDLAEIFIELNDDERDKLYSLLSSARLAELVSYLESDDAAEILSDFDIKKQKELFEMMEPDDAADIIGELEDDEQEELLKVLGKNSDVARLIQYDEDETGSAMTTEIIVLTTDMDVKQATKKVMKEAADVESINTLFVVDSNQQFLGVVPLIALIKAKTPCMVLDIVEQSPFVKDYDLITQSLEAINNYGIFEMPVCNENQQLLGMITLDDALDLYQEEAQEDFERLAGLPETIDRTPIKTALHRLPWLVLLLAISVPIALISSHFQDVITAVAILIIFQPLISGSAGNVATQTLAVTLKMFSTNEKGIFFSSIREILTGMINGLVIGSIAFGTTFLFASLHPSISVAPISVAFVVGASLWLTVFVAPIVAILIPTLLRIFKLDPAVASGPFISTLLDMTGLSIYFGLATLVFGGLL